MSKEIWKDIKGYEGHYQVSNLGSIKSLKFGKERILKPSKDRDGYLLVVLSKDSKPKTFTVHQLIAIAFLDHTPNGHKIVIDHIDNDKLNNYVGNLQLVTQRKNTTKDRLRGSSKYIGVCWYKPYNKWQAKININGIGKHLGYFECELAAAKAYNDALNNNS